MELILWRHADAEPHGFGQDRDRKLTPLGEKQAAKMAHILKMRLPSSDLTIYCSPALRCRQTVNALQIPYITSPKLDTDASVLDLLELTNWHSDSVSKHTILVCSHQPTLGQTVSTILTGQPHYWTFKKGSIWWLSSRIRGHDSNAWVRVVLTPDIL